jgi:hypothetical protein
LTEIGFALKGKEMKWNALVICSLVPMALTMVGCMQQGDNRQSAAAPEAVSSTPDVDGSKYLLDVEPVGALSVIAARETVEDGEDVLVVGRIGGSESPWVEGRAAFSIVDATLKACSDIPGDNCETPWDYCCETPNLPSATAMVKIVDDDGSIVNADVRKLLGVEGLSTVVIQGESVRDDAGNLTILATGVFVRS